MRMIHKMLLLLIISSCRPSEDVDCHKRLFFQNSSQQAKYIVWTENVIVGDECNLFLHAEFEAGQREEILGSNNSCLETPINNTYNGSIIIYVFENNPNITECDSVAGHPDIIERMEFTVEDLNSLGWVIEYP